MHVHVLADEGEAKIWIEPQIEVARNHRLSDQPFDDFPWFRDATIRQLATIERPSGDHFYWPELGVDLTLDSIEHPEAYPLVSRAASARPPNESFQG